MKKLLVLMLVFGMASWASASFTILDPVDIGGGDYSITVTSDGADADGYWALGIDSAGSLGSIAIGADAPSMSGIWGNIDPDLASYLPGLTGKYGAFASASGETKVSGDYLTATASIASIPIVYLYSFNESYVFTLEDSAEVPEPMTIALLGLGGLFLRRRR